MNILYPGSEMAYIRKEGMFRFNYTALVDKIYNYHDTITDPLYKKDIKSYAAFIKSIFDAAKPPYLFENQIIYYLKMKGDRFVISIDELTTYQLNYFTEMAESNHCLSEETLWLYWGARDYYQLSRETPKNSSDKWRFEPDLVAKMKSYLSTKDPTEFLKFSIQQSIYDRSQVSISQQVLDMFGHPEEYREIIAESTSLADNVKDEYLKLFDKLAANGFQQYIEMELRAELRRAESD